MYMYNVHVDCLREGRPWKRLQDQRNFEVLLHSLYHIKGKRLVFRLSTTHNTNVGLGGF